MEKRMRVTIDGDLVARLRMLAATEGDGRSGVATVVNRMLRSALTAAKVKDPARPARTKAAP
jgi:hypothetical protein